MNVNMMKYESLSEYRPSFVSLARESMHLPVISEQNVHADREALAPLGNVIKQGLRRNGEEVNCIHLQPGGICRVRGCMSLNQCHMHHR